METVASNPLITVIIPVYNTEPYLRQCLDSVCGQTYGNLEIICVNDGSTDGSQAILEEYAARDARVKVLVQENAGQAVARNRALDIARGEWVTGVDSDDWIERNTYEKVIGYAKNSVDIVYFGTFVEGEADSKQTAALKDYTDVHHEGEREIGSRAALEIDDCIWNKLFRMEVIQRHHLRFPEGLIYEDVFFVRGMLAVSRNIWETKQKFYHYILRSDSTMGKSAQKTPRARERLEIIRLTYLFYVQQGKEVEYRNMLLSRFCSCYRGARKDVPEDMLPQVFDEAWNVARLMGIDKLRFQREIQEIRQMRRNCIWKIFHNSLQNKDSYGIGHLHCLTILHNEGQDVYFLCGRKIFQRHRKCC